MGYKKIKFFLTNFLVRCNEMVPYILGTAETVYQT
jgi:hypothetical protein